MNVLLRVYGQRLMHIAGLNMGSSSVNLDPLFGGRGVFNVEHVLFSVGILNPRSINSGPYISVALKYIGAWSLTFFCTTASMHGG